jgi:hypothetical protein
MTEKLTSAPAPRLPDEGPQLLDEFISKALQKYVKKQCISWRLLREEVEALIGLG